MNAIGLFLAVVLSLSGMPMDDTPAPTCQLADNVLTGCPGQGGAVIGGHLDVWNTKTTSGPGGAPRVPLSNPTIPTGSHDLPPDMLGIPTLTLSDLASFRPSPGTDHMEPNGWAVVGLDTNFYATVGQQVQTGELLGEPVSVRFTPVRYRWTYGDGSSATKTTRGGTWKALNIRPFDPTPTSHIFRERGTFTITLSIEFTAEYQFEDAPWIAVNGTLPLPANPLSVRVGTAKTVLVAHDCIQDPSGPGC